VFDQNFTFDVSNHSDLIRIEKMVEKLSIPSTAKKAILNELGKIKKAQ
jgi:hypothetical protein